MVLDRVRRGVARIPFLLAGTALALGVTIVLAVAPTGQSGLTMAIVGLAPGLCIGFGIIISGCRDLLRQDWSTGEEGEKL